MLSEKLTADARKLIPKSIDVPFDYVEIIVNADATLTVELTNAGVVMWRSRGPEMMTTDRLHCGPFRGAIQIAVET